MNDFNRSYYTSEHPLSDPYPAPNYQYDKIRENNNPLWFKIVSIVLLVALILTAIYTLLHPLDKIKLKFFLFRSCTIELVATNWGQSEYKKLRIDGNLLQFGSSYYEIDGNRVYEYVKTGKNTWTRILSDEEWTKGDIGEKLLDKKNYKHKEEALFVWRLKNSVAETIDELSSITLERDAGKIAIVGYRYTTRIAIRFTRFGTTKIDPPWEERGMIVVD